MLEIFGHPKIGGPRLKPF